MSEWINKQIQVVQVSSLFVLYVTKIMQDERSLQSNKPALTSLILKKEINELVKTLPTHEKY